MKVEQPNYNIKNFYINFPFNKALNINDILKSKTGKTCLNIGEPSSKAKYNI